MNNIKIAEKYFELFSNKELNALSEMWDDNITLRDWEIEASGRENVFMAIHEAFNSVESIKAIPINFGTWQEYGKPATVIAELDLIINESERICVVDIIDFTDEGKIKSIRAFKG